MLRRRMMLAEQEKWELLAEIALTEETAVSTFTLTPAKTGFKKYKIIGDGIALDKNGQFWLFLKQDLTQITLFSYGKNTDGSFEIFIEESEERIHFYGISTGQDSWMSEVNTTFDDYQKVDLEDMYFVFKAPSSNIVSGNIKIYGTN